ncbi:MAG: tetratricopeptide repeat protein [Nonlabens sp.]
MRQLLLIFTTLSTFYLAGAQQSMIYTDELATYNKALDLYQAEQYNAAQRLFHKASEQTDDDTIKGNAAYYVANCAVRLNQNNADELVQQFVQEYPTSTKRNTAVVDIADYYFDNGNFNQARKWYGRVDEGTLSRKRKSQYHFNYGYTYVLNKRYDEAAKYLNKVSSHPEYGEQATYYLGYMAYAGDELQEAAKLFDKVKNLPSNDDRLGYYKADLYYNLGEFDKAIEMAQEYLPRADRNERSQLNRIIGQSLFNQKKYAASLSYLEAYRGERGKLNNNDLYQIGYVHFVSEDYGKAIEVFNKILGGRDATAQNAYYHLGQSYIKANRTEDALNAFKLASELDFNKEINKDALYNYAKLSYEYGNPYESVSRVLISYIDKYPEAANLEEMNDYLIDSYFSSKNYKEAIELIEKRGILGSETVYARVSLFQGFRDYEESNYQTAIKRFDKAIVYFRKDTQRKRAHFWRAHSLYQLNNYDEAIISFGKAAAIEADIPENDILNYDLGYTHFQMKNYSQAISYFQQYVSLNNDDRVRSNDAQMRIADSYYVLKQYNEAIPIYDKIVAGSAINSDYAQFQKAMSRGFTGDNDAKIRDLKKFITDFKQSKYRDDVLYELGNTYINAGNNNEGQRVYDQLIQEFPNSSYTAPAMMRKGLQLYNANELNRALTVFKRVAEKYQGTPQAIEAISSARQIYIDQGNTNDYAAWVRTLDGVEVTNNELDDIAYESAEQPYIRGKYSTASKGLNSYLIRFPNGKHALKANFYLGQSFYAIGEPDKSIAPFEKVILKERNEFTEQALARLSELYLGKKDVGNSIRVLEELEKYADFPQNVLYARSNLMKLYYERQQYRRAATYAELVQQTPGVEQKVLDDTMVIVARSYWEQKDLQKARKAYADLQKTATGSLAAEAIYYKAYFEFTDQNYDATIKTIGSLTKNYGSYRLWSNKGLILMGKSYYEKDELLNATTIFEAVANQATKYPELVSEAQTELNRIKAEQNTTEPTKN